MGKRRALLIGTQHYVDDPSLKVLNAPGEDVRALAAVLGDPEIGAYDELQVHIDAKVQAIRLAVSVFLRSCSRDDVALLYFSGHGLLDSTGLLYLAATDTQKKYLRATALASGDIREQMDACRSEQQILILDCCHGGAVGRTKGEGTVSSNLIFETKGRGRIILTASDATEFAFEGDEVEKAPPHSVFTHCLVKGLMTGAADRDADGVITIDELYAYVDEEVRFIRPEQRPTFWSFQQMGKLAIAKSAKKPGVVSIELRTGIISRTPSKRRWAVLELFDLCEAVTPDQKPGVLEELQKLTRDPDPGVRMLAIENWEKLQPRPDSRPTPPDPTPPDPTPPDPTPPDPTPPDPAQSNPFRTQNYRLLAAAGAALVGLMGVASLVVDLDRGYDAPGPAYGQGQDSLPVSQMNGVGSPEPPSQPQSTVACITTRDCEARACQVAHCEAGGCVWNDSSSAPADADPSDCTVPACNGGLVTTRNVVNGSRCGEGICVDGTCSTVPPLTSFGPASEVLVYKSSGQCCTTRWAGDWLRIQCGSTDSIKVSGSDKSISVKRREPWPAGYVRTSGCGDFTAAPEELAAYVHLSEGTFASLEVSYRGGGGTTLNAEWKTGDLDPIQRKASYGSGHDAFIGHMRPF